jgi:hypothetical protein
MSQRTKVIISIVRSDTSSIQADEKVYTWYQFSSLNIITSSFAQTAEIIHNYEIKNVVIRSLDEV